MATCLDLMANLKALDIKAIARTAMQATADAFTESNRDQMLEGKRRDGTKMGDSPGERGYYQSMTYARDKQRQNSRAGFGNPDLKLTGAFHGGMYMNIKGDDVVMDSTDSKTKMLVSDYGATIFGLNQDSKVPYVADHLEPVTQELITKQTGLKFT